MGTHYSGRRSVWKPRRLIDSGNTAIEFATIENHPQRDARDVEYAQPGILTARGNLHFSGTRCTPQVTNTGVLSVVTIAG